MAGVLIGGFCAAQPMADFEQQVVARINEIRRQHDLQPLQMNPVLRDVARRYSETMDRRSFFRHTGPSGDTVADRVRNAGLCFRAVGENLAKNYNVDQPVDAAVTGWMHSDSHRHNILMPQYRQTGVGVWRDGPTYYFTQVFYRAMPPGHDCASGSRSPSTQGQQAQPEG